MYTHRVHALLSRTEGLLGAGSGLSTFTNPLNFDRMQRSSYLPEDSQLVAEVVADTCVHRLINTRRLEVHGKRVRRVVRGQENFFKYTF